VHPFRVEAFVHECAFGLDGAVENQVWDVDGFSSWFGADAPREEFSTFHVDKSDLLYWSAGSATEYSREEVLARVASRIRCAINGCDLARFIAGAGTL
jgi:hypothetical protein